MAILPKPRRVASRFLTDRPNPGMPLLPRPWSGLPVETRKRIAQSFAPLLTRMRPRRAPIKADRHDESIG